MTIMMIMMSMMVMRTKMMFVKVRLGTSSEEEHREWDPREELRLVIEKRETQVQHQTSISCATARPAVVDSEGPSSIIKGPNIRSFVAIYALFGGKSTD